MALNPNVAAALDVATRSAMDEHVNVNVLDRHTSAVQLLRKTAFTDSGAKLQSSLIYKRKDTQVVSSGMTPLDRDPVQPFGFMEWDWVRFQKGHTVDGFAYQKNTGERLSAAIARQDFSMGNARTLIDMEKKSILNERAGILQDINHAIIHGATVSDNGGLFKFNGLVDICKENQSFGGRKHTDFGQFEWESAVRPGTNSYIHNPVYLDCAGIDATEHESGTGAALTGNVLHIYTHEDGSLEDVMIDLCNAGSRYSEMGLEFEYISLWNQQDFAAIQKNDYIRGLLRRTTNEADIGGVGGLKWDAYNLSFYTDSDMPKGMSFIYNTVCFRLGQLDEDWSFYRNWAQGETTDSLLIRMDKGCQTWMDNRSQFGKVFNFDHVVI